MSHKTAGSALVTLQLVVAVVGVLATVPPLPDAREPAQDPARDRAATAYAQSVYRAAQAYLAENPNSSSVATSCLAGYVPATGSRILVPFLGPFIQSCTIKSDGTQVTVTYTGGMRDSVRVGH